MDGEFPGLWLCGGVIGTAIGFGGSGELGWSGV